MELGYEGVQRRGRAHSNDDMVVDEAVEEVLDEADVLWYQAREATEDARAHDLNCNRVDCAKAAAAVEKALKKARELFRVARLIPGITYEDLGEIQVAVEVIEGYVCRACAAVEPYTSQGIVIEQNPEFNFEFDPSPVADADLRANGSGEYIPSEYRDFITS